MQECGLRGVRRLRYWTANLHQSALFSAADPALKPATVNQGVVGSSPTSGARFRKGRERSRPFFISSGVVTAEGRPRGGLLLSRMKQPNYQQSDSAAGPVSVFNPVLLID